MAITSFGFARSDLRTLAVTAAALTLAACGGSNLTLAQASDIQLSAPGGQLNTASAPVGATSAKPPYYTSVSLNGDSLKFLQSISFTVEPKPGAVSAPVHVTWTKAALEAHGYYTSGGGTLSLPVFGLYANYGNQVTITVTFPDASAETFPMVITTPAYTDPYGVYDQPTILKSRAPGSALGYNYMMLKSTVGGPVIVDTDGEVRWEALGVANAESSTLLGGSFLIGSETSNQVFNLQWDGTQTGQTLISNPDLIEFTHNIDPGKVGLLAEFSGTDSLGNDGDAIVAEIVPETNSVAQTAKIGIPKIWDMALVIANYMLSQGDDAAAFVRPNADWFHLNAAAYDPSDDSILVSSRENFVIKLDYSTGNIIWIFGDPTKYWYTFPSLRAKALTLAPGGLYPVGQHGISVTSAGYLLLFNDGAGSENQPTGEPAGIFRTYSAVNAYAIDTATMTAQQIMNFDYNQSIFASFCGSVYESSGTYLVDYSTADNLVHDRLVGLDANQNVAFDFQYNSSIPCGTSWNAIPVPLENLQITQ